MLAAVVDRTEATRPTVDLAELEMTQMVVVLHRLIIILRIQTQLLERKTKAAVVAVDKVEQAKEPLRRAVPAS